MPVADHWHIKWNDTTQDARNGWFDTPVALMALWESCDKSKSKGAFKFNVGRDSEGPAEEEKKPMRH